MKKFRRVLGLLLALVMAMSMGISAMAATIIIDDGDVTGATYDAYKLMNVTIGTTQDSQGNDVETYSYSVNSKYSSVLQTATGKGTDEEVLTYIQSLTSRSDEMNALAEAIYAEIGKANLAADATTTSGSFSNVDAGYYLIIESAVGTLPSGTTDTYSIYMLDTAGNDTTTVETKESVPTLIKKVQEKNDSVYSSTTGAWQDGADYDIGDEVPFRLTGTVSNQYKDYDTYYYAFHDTLSPGLTFTASSVKVYVENGSTTTQLSSSEYTVNTSPTDGCSFEVIITDLKKLTSATVSSSSLIVVEYTAKLNENAVIGSTGNPNVAYLEYANNPYSAGTGKTPEDKVIVFTYQLEVDKYSSNGNTLNGAGFTLYKYYASNENQGSWIAVGTEQKYTDGYVFTWTGLDAGYYKLEETTVPSGYTKASDITFTVTAAYDTESDNPGFTSLQVTINSGTGSISGTPSATESSGKVLIHVVNKTGSEMPTTGGIGTTIFYIIGSILALGAAVLLVTKRRMGRAH